MYMYIYVNTEAGVYPPAFQHYRDECHLVYKHQNTSIAYTPIRNLVNKHQMFRTCIMRQLDRRGSTNSDISIRIGTHSRHLIRVNTSADIKRGTDLNIITSFVLGKMLVSILLSKFCLYVLQSRFGVGRFMHYGYP